jgi:hypothetical protein
MFLHEHVQPIKLHVESRLSLDSIERRPSPVFLFCKCRPKTPLGFGTAEGLSSRSHIIVVGGGEGQGCSRRETE